MHVTDVNGFMPLSLRHRPDSLLLTHPCLRVPLDIVVCILSTFDSNFEIEDDFTKYFKERCW